MADYVVLWVLCAIPVAVIADYKQLHVPTWFFLGAVLGVIGILAVLVQPRRSSIWGRSGDSAKRRDGGGGGGGGWGGGGGCGGGGCGGGGG